MKYEFLSHTADVKVRAYGNSVGEAFTSAALALKKTVAGNIAIAAECEKTVAVKGGDPEALLYGFIEEFLYLLDAESFMLSEILEINVAGNKVQARVLGDDARNYEFANSVKAVTYSEMQVAQKDGKWTAQFVLDV